MTASHPCVCGHAHHEGPCAAPTLTDHFEGTNHGGIVPCGCPDYEADDDQPADDQVLKPDYTTNGYNGIYGNCPALGATP